MKKVYKAHIIYTKEHNRFEVLENGYVVVDDKGRVIKVSSDLSVLGCEDAEIIDFGDSLLIPAMDASAGMGKLAFLPAVVGFWAGTLFLLLLEMRPMPDGCTAVSCVIYGDAALCELVYLPLHIPKIPVCLCACFKRQVWGRSWAKWV